jgi:hypothetical protein
MIFRKVFAATAYWNLTSSQSNFEVARCGSTEVDVKDAPVSPDEYGDTFPFGEIQNKIDGEKYADPRQAYRVQRLCSSPPILHWEWVS